MNLKMKLSILGIICLMLLPFGSVFSQIRGNRKVVKQTREVSGFNSIVSKGSVDIYLTQSDTEDLYLEADENLLDVIITKVKDNTLYIYCDKSIFNASELKAYIKVKNLNGIILNGSGDFYSENTINADVFNFKITGSGDMDLLVDANKILGLMTGSGDADIHASADVFDVKMKGSGDILVEDLKTNICNIRVYGSGDAKISGDSETLNIIQYGSGDVDLYDFPVKKCVIKKTGSGDAKVFVENELIVYSKGSGDVYFKGSPDKEKISCKGSGDVYRK